LSTIIRKLVGERWESTVTISEAWTLRSQVEALEGWLRGHRGELDPSCQWVADIGFAHRADATGGGPPLTRDLMQMCLEANLEIYLSEYSFDAKEGEP
jgi:hypothetical protein